MANTSYAGDYPNCVINKVKKDLNGTFGNLLYKIYEICKSIVVYIILGRKAIFYPFFNYILKSMNLNKNA